jgi:hypothetical protein
MMKKKIAALLALASLVVGPMQVLATDTPVVNPGASGAEVGVSLTQVQQNSTVDPIVIKAKWEMRAKRSTDTNSAKRVGYWVDGANYNNYWYEDDDPTARTDGAQFYPSGDENVFSYISVCGVIDHPWLRNASDLSKFVVSADVYYPEVESVGKQFCGNFYKEIILSPLAYNDGIKLMCGLDAEQGVFQRDPSIVSRYGFSESDICYQLAQEQSKVFCGILPLSYEAPAGDYLVKIIANGQGLSPVEQTNYFTYYQLPSFKIDNTSVAYNNGNPIDTNVENNLSGTVEGDPLFVLNDGKPTLKGTGNVQLNIRVEQDDMGFGESTMSDQTIKSNVLYKARLGNAVNWANIGYYKPTNTNQISSNDYVDLSTLDLSQDQKLDLGVLVKKFPPTHPVGSPYAGAMTLTGTAIPFESCSVN